MYVTKIIGAQPDITIRDRANDITSLEYYRTTMHADASHMRQVGSYYWSQYINYIITYGAYGDISKKNSGYCGLGEMWGFYVGGLLATERYGGDRHTHQWSWFRPWIVRRLVENAGLTPEQIYQCLTSDVRSHEQLRNKLISSHGNQQKINAAFAFYGF